jgi:predicted aminopeptidase
MQGMIGKFARMARKIWRFKRISIIVLLIAVALIVTGCQAASFYTQAIRGQYQIMHARRAIPEVIADTNTTAELRERLQFVTDLRAFATKELKLPVEGNYEDYADIKRKHVVWNVYAALEFSLEPKTWRYPFVGSLAYRGYFSEKAARDYAQKLAQKGYDVYVAGIPAYSTLGWFNDPILNTFVFDAKNELADTVFHELAHHRVFAEGDTEFNEAFAMSVGEEGVRRWLLARDDPKAWEAYQREARYDRGFVALILATRANLAALYATMGNGERMNIGQARQKKSEVFDKLRGDYQNLRTQWDGYSGFDKWFSTNLNNAKLNTVSTYYKWVPAFRYLIATSGGDLEKFYGNVESLSKMPVKERHAKMDEFLRETETHTEKAK